MPAEDCLEQPIATPKPAPKKIARPALAIQLPNTLVPPVQALYVSLLRGDFTDLRDIDNHKIDSALLKLFAYLKLLCDDANELDTQCLDYLSPAEPVDAVSVAQQIGITEHRINLCRIHIQKMLNLLPDIQNNLHEQLEILLNNLQWCTEDPEAFDRLVNTFTQLELHTNLQAHPSCCDEYPLQYEAIRSDYEDGAHLAAERGERRYTLGIMRNEFDTTIPEVYHIFLNVFGFGSNNPIPEFEEIETPNGVIYALREGGSIVSTSIFSGPPSDEDHIEDEYSLMSPGSDSDESSSTATTVDGVDPDETAPFPTTWALV